MPIQIFEPFSGQDELVAVSKVYDVKGAWKSFATYGDMTASIGDFGTLSEIYPNAVNVPGLIDLLAPGSPLRTNFIGHSSILYVSESKEFYIAERKPANLAGIINSSETQNEIFDKTFDAITPSEFEFIKVVFPTASFAVTASHALNVTTAGVSSLTGLTGAITLTAGPNITINTNGNDIEISGSGGGGDVSALNAFTSSIQTSVDLQEDRIDQLVDFTGSFTDQVGEQVRITINAIPTESIFSFRNFATASFGTKASASIAISKTTPVIDKPESGSYGPGYGTGDQDSIVIDFQTGFIRMVQNRTGVNAETNFKNAINDKDIIGGTISAPNTKQFLLTASAIINDNDDLGLSVQYPSIPSPDNSAIRGIMSCSVSESADNYFFNIVATSNGTFANRIRIALVSGSMDPSITPSNVSKVAPALVTQLQGGTAYNTDVAQSLGATTAQIPVLDISGSNDASASLRRMDLSSFLNEGLLPDIIDKIDSLIVQHSKAQFQAAGGASTADLDADGDGNIGVTDILAILAVFGAQVGDTVQALPPPDPSDFTVGRQGSTGNFKDGLREAGGIAEDGNNTFTNGTFSIGNQSSGEFVIEGTDLIGFPAQIEFLDRIGGAVGGGTGSGILTSSGSLLFRSSSAGSFEFNRPLHVQGQISASGNIIGNNLTANGTTNLNGYVNLNGDVTTIGDSTNDRLHINSYITSRLNVQSDISASGNITASGTIVASNLSGTNTGDQDLSSYIQASQTGSFLTSLADGTISSSAQITAFGFISSSHTDIESLNTFTGSIQTQVNDLTAATSSYITEATFPYTGSAEISGSINFTGKINNTSIYSGGQNNGSTWILPGVDAQSNTADAYYQVRIGGFQSPSVNPQRIVYVGYGAGNGRTGNGNVAIGTNAGSYGFNTGIDSVLIGENAGRGRGNNNVIIGKDAGGFNGSLTPQYNTFLGYNAGGTNLLTGNIALGKDTGLNASSDYSTIIGYEAGYNISGSKNVILGYQAGYNLTGSNQLIIANTGSHALITGDFAEETLYISGTLGLNDGNDNTVLGEDSLLTRVSSSRNTLVGYEAGKFLSYGSDNVFIGYQAGISESIVTTNYSRDNIAIGSYALSNNDYSYNNVAIGKNALKNVTRNGSNIAIGNDAGSNLTGNNGTNIFIGSAGPSAAEQIIAIGRDALANNSGTSNIGIGVNSLRFSVGGQNVAVGLSSGYNGITGKSALFGHGAGYLYSGGNIVALGYGAGSRGEGDNSTIVGFEAGYYASGSTNVIIGYQAGYNLTGSNQLVIANNSASALIEGDFANETVTISGSLYVSGSITAGSFVGIESVDITDLNTFTSSIQTEVDNLTAATSSYITEATFPYTGSAIISGSLEVIGDITGSPSFNIHAPNRTTGIKIGNSTTTTVGDRSMAIGINATANTYDEISIGYNAGAKGSGNPASSVYIGNSSGNGGAGNGNGQRIGIGHSTLSSNSGRYNIAIGDQAGRFGSGESNVMIGASAGYMISSAGQNVMIGQSAGNGSVGSGNIALGYVANGGDGDYNIALGYRAGNSSMSGEKNVLIGYYAGNEFTTESNKLIIANNSASALITGDFANETVTISGSLYVSGSITAGSFVGIESVDITDLNTFTGSIQTQVDNLTAATSSYITEATFPYTGSAGISGSLEVIGPITAVNKPGGTTIDITNITTANHGSEGVYIGYNAAPNNTLARNIVIGKDAGANSTSMYDTVVIGANAGESVSSGMRSSVTIGTFAGMSTNGLGSSVTIGAYAGRYTDGGFNVFLGHSAGYWYEGGSSILIGRTAGYSANGQTDGDRNMYIGYSAGSQAQGDDNITLGYQAGYNALGSKNIIIGYQAGYNHSGSNQLVIANTGSRALIEGDFANETVTISGSLFVSGSITAGSFVGIESVDITDLNTFTGSIQTQVDSLTAATSSYLTSIPANTLSSSAQIATEISGAFTAASSSFSTRVTTIESITDSLSIITVDITTDATTQLDAWPTASYRGAIYDYVLYDDDQNSRTGHFMVSAIGNYVSFTDTSTPDSLGDASPPSIAASKVGTDVAVRISNGNGYTFKAFTKKL